MNKSYDQQLTELQTKAKIISEEYASLVKRAREKEAEGEAIKLEYLKLKKLKLEEKKTTAPATGAAAGTEGAQAATKPYQQ